MLLLGSTGGGGSTYVLNRLRDFGWRVCQRPDAGHQKVNNTLQSTWRVRTKDFMEEPQDLDNMTTEALFQYTHSQLKRQDQNRLAMLCLEWGGRGLFHACEGDIVVYMLRDPLFAFNSYSGGTEWSGDKGRRIRYVGGAGPNDKKWIDAFFGDFSFWRGNAENALQAVRAGTGHVVRYEHFEQDWKRLGEFPPIYKGFKCADSMGKVTSHLTLETISYIRDVTGDVWNQLCDL